MGHQRFGMSNPNYRHGNYCGDFGNDLRQRFQLQAKLRELLSMDLTKNNPTAEEMRWVRLVIEEWPEWAIDILRGNGFKKPGEK